MITDYTIISTPHKKVKEVCIWKHMIWLDRNQLELLFHVKKSRIETMLDYVDHHKQPLNKHSIVLSIVKYRQLPNGKREWIKQVRHYDLDIMQALLEIESHHDAQCFLNWAQEMRATL